jgi:hypothetical protein
MGANAVVSHLFGYGPAYGCALAIFVVAIQLIQCHTYHSTCESYDCHDYHITCESDTFTLPMACNERACFNARAGEGHSYSTISETAMQGNAIGGKALFATTMALVGLLFVPYVSLLHKLLSSSPLLDDRIPCCGCNGCCVQDSACITRLASRVGYAACVFLAVLALVAVDDSFIVHGAAASIFFCCITTYALLITSIIKSMDQRLHGTTAPLPLPALLACTLNTLQAKTVEDGRWCLRFKMCTTAAVLFFFVLLPVVGGMAIVLLYPTDPTYVAVAGSNLRSFCQWCTVAAVHAWVASLSFEVRNLEVLGLLVPRLHGTSAAHGTAHDADLLGPPVVVQAVAVQAVAVVPADSTCTADC